MNVAGDAQRLRRLRIDVSAPGRLVAAAALVNRVRCRTSLRDPEGELLRWARVAATLGEAGPPALLPEGWFGTEAEILDRCFAALRAAGGGTRRPLAAARSAALSLLGHPR